MSLAHYRSRYTVNLPSRSVSHTHAQPKSSKPRIAMASLQPLADTNDGSEDDDEYVTPRTVPMIIATMRAIHMRLRR